MRKADKVVMITSILNPINVLMNKFSCSFLFAVTDPRDASSDRFVLSKVVL